MPLIKVCDAIMGSGKTSAAIDYMNTHYDQKFIFITPYLDEAKRIKDGCPNVDFVEPSAKLSTYKYQKGIHTAKLIDDGRNIATTHQAFAGYTKEMIKRISEQGYTLIIDESINVLEPFEYSPEDLRVAVDAGLVKYNDGVFELVKKDYNGIMFHDLFRMLESKQLRTAEGDGVGIKKQLCWTLPKELLASFRNIFILTYLFEAQSICYLLKLYGMGYEKIGVARTADGGFRFGRYNEYVPEYVSSIGDYIHILDKNKLNAIGDDEFSLSATWFRTKADQQERLKNNTVNFFMNICKESAASERMWSTYKAGYGKVKGKGYTKGFLEFNARATNSYRNKKYLAYLANVFVNLNEKMFFREYGVEVDDDLYATSVMIQWIWRSAIRDGKEVYIYLPSRRMRNLLTDWIDSLDKEVSSIAS